MVVHVALCHHPPTSIDDVIEQSTIANGNRHLSSNVDVGDAFFDGIKLALYLPPNQGGIPLVGEGYVEEIMAFQPVEVSTCNIKSI